MDSSRRAVESYWRSQMIDGATSEECKITAVYKLEEICELLRSSHSSTVKQISEFILKRLDHRNPIVKQKALRLIKYAVVKSGMEFRREMQRNSSSVRQLFHYKGHADLLRGDALNKAVRDTAHEAIAAIFCEESKMTNSESIAKRIQGFGNTAAMELQLDDKKSFISEVVGFGSASIRQGLTNIVQAHLMSKKDGRYKGPTLRRSLTVNSSNTDGYEVVENTNEGFGGFGISNKVVEEGHLGVGLRSMSESSEVRSSVEEEYVRSRADKLLETVVGSGGVRLQPTRDALQGFVVEAAKLDASALCNAVELKLGSNSWQVKVKAVCVLESILRQKDEPFLTVASYFNKNRDSLLKCSESPQSSLIERANKVLRLLDGELQMNILHKQGSSKPNIPDLIDKSYSDPLSSEPNRLDPDAPPVTPLVTPPVPPTVRSSIVDLFSEDIQSTGLLSPVKTDPDDPFSDVSFHDKHTKNTVFSDSPASEKSSFLDIFGASPEPTPAIGSGSKGGYTGGHLPLDIVFSDLNISRNIPNSSGIIPDIFHVTPPDSTAQINCSTRQEPAAFDFISDHVAAARDGKKTVGLI